jgi:hypothetical protein
LLLHIFRFGHQEHAIAAVFAEQAMLVVFI